MYPHERSLVTKYKDRPFVILGVNGDDPARLKAICEKNELTWRSWASGTKGPIVQQYKVRSWPTIFVLDKDGIIRYKNVRGDTLENAIESLVKQAE